MPSESITQRSHIDVSVEGSILRLRFTRGYSSEEFADMLNKVTQFVSKPRPFHVFADVRDASLPNALQRKQFANLMIAHKANLEANCKGWAVVLNTAIESGIITAIVWVVSPRYPLRVFTDVQSASKWLESL